MNRTIKALLALGMAVSLAACGGSSSSAAATAAAEGSASAAAGGGSSSESGKVYNVAYLVNGNLGDKSFFDSAEAGLEQLKADGRITLTTIEMGGTDEDKPKWLQTLYDVSDEGDYDVIVCGTYQMPVIFDDDTYAGQDANVCNIVYKQNELGYIIGTFAACTTLDTSLEHINEDKVIGFVGGYDSPVINDFLYGYIEGAQAVDPEIKVDTRYTSDYVDTAKAKEYAYSMINDSKCDIIWGVAGNAGNGAAEAVLESGNAWFIGVDSDQEQTLSSDLAAITLTSGLKNVGNSLIWFFDELDAGNEHYGERVSLGIAEGGVGIVTDKNYDKYLSDDIKNAVQAAIDGISDGSIKVDSALTDDGNTAAQALRDSAQPSAN